MEDSNITLRHPRVGDIGWIIYRHAVLYTEEYGWNEQFEALVGEVASSFLRNHDPQKERCWIAELDGKFAGSIFLVKHPMEEGTAKLRLLLVEPHARKQGIGRTLIAECLAFAKSAGYSKVTLWTNDVLLAARHLYEDFGFELIHEEPNVLLGPPTMAQTWERKV